MKTSAWIILGFIGISLLLSSCGPQTAATPTPMPIIETPALIKPEAPNIPTETPSALGEYMIPAYYPDSYISIVNGSKNEKNLVIYSNMREYNWDSLIKVFRTHYPWIKVTLVSTGPTETFTRYDQEVSKNQPTADMLISSDPVGWLKFFEDRKVQMYASQEDPYIPDAAKSVYGSYAVSAEPMLIIYNKKLVHTPPKDMIELAGFVKNNPSAYLIQIASTDAETNAIGFAANWFWIDEQGSSGWDILSTVGESQPVFMDSESKVVEAVGTGRVKIGYFISSSAVIPLTKTYPDIGWTYMTSQPVLLNSMAITEKAANPNSAKLMMDFILSQEGQYSLALGGLTPFRSDISAITDYHLDRLYTDLGDNNVHLHSFDPKLNNQATIDDFIEKWRNAVNKEADSTPVP